VFDVGVGGGGHVGSDGDQRVMLAEMGMNEFGFCGATLNLNTAGRRGLVPEEGSASAENILR